MSSEEGACRQWLVIKPGGDERGGGSSAYTMYERKQ